MDAVVGLGREHHTVIDYVGTQQPPQAKKVESWNHMEPKKEVLVSFFGKNPL
jgi:hypothetical protein